MMQSKRLNRRDFLRLSALTAAGAVLAGCTEPEPVIQTQQVVETKVVTETKEVVATPTPEPTEVPLLGGTIEGHVVCMHFLHEFTEDHVALFQEENPGITLEVIAADLTRFFAMYAAGSPPDLLRVQAPSIPQYLAREMLYDLTPFFEVSDMLSLDDLAPANNYYRAYDPLHVGDGPIYGMCKDFSPDFTIFSYTTIFEDAGVAVPGDQEPLTYQEVAELSRAVSQFEGDRTLIFGYHYETGWVDRIMMNMLAEIDGSLYTEDMSRLVITDNEAAFEVARYYYDLAAEKLCQSIINPSTTGWFGNDFTAGTLALAQYGFWFGAMAESEVNAGNVMMLPGPTWTGVRRDPTMTATGMIMAAATKVPEAAWKVFEFYNAGQPALDRAASGWGVPALKSMYDLMPNTTEYEQQKLAVLLDELALDTPPLQFSPFLGEATVAQSWNTQIDRALLGELTFEEAVANVESEVNAAIQDGVDRLL